MISKAREAEDNRPLNPNFQELQFNQGRDHVYTSVSPCLQQQHITCWVSRPYEKTFLLRYMLTASVICIILSILDFIWVLYGIIIKSLRRKIVEEKIMKRTDFYSRVSLGLTKKGRADKTTTYLEDTCKLLDNHHQMSMFDDEHNDNKFRLKCIVPRQLGSEFIDNFECIFSKENEFRLKMTEQNEKKGNAMARGASNNAGGGGGQSYREIGEGGRVRTMVSSSSSFGSTFCGTKHLYLSDYEIRQIELSGGKISSRYLTGRSRLYPYGQNGEKAPGPEDDEEQHQQQDADAQLREEEERNLQNADMGMD